MHEHKGVKVYQEGEFSSLVPDSRFAVVAGGPFQSEGSAVKRASKLGNEHFVIHIPENRATKEYWSVLVIKK